MDPRTIAGYPENTAYDRTRHEKMRLRNIKYGFIRIHGERENPLCSKCETEIYEENYLKINDEAYHRKCFDEKCAS